MLQIHYLLYKLRFIFFGTLGVVTAFLILWVMAITVENMHLQPASSATTVNAGSDSPNAVTRAVSAAAYSFNRTVDNTAAATSNGLTQSAAATVHAGNAVWHAIGTGAHAVGAGIVWAVKGIGSAVAVAAKTVGNAIVFVLKIPGNVFGFVSKTSSAVIRPADHNPVPIIDSNAPEVLAAKTALPATPTADQPAPETAIWPMHGQVTTEFGVAGWPYKTVHAGIDISDGKPSGVTPIKAFRSGKVIATERSGGLGNHVVVDHGSGVTSVYGHLASMHVQVGQNVNTATTLGYEGTTGVSTGTHLHFEIRVNGQATDPRQFINGLP